MKKVVVVYPYDTGKSAFSGGVSKVAISNLIALQEKGYQGYFLLPQGNSGLIAYVKEAFPAIEIVPVDFEILKLYVDTKGIWKYLNVIKTVCNFFLKKKNLKKTLRKISPDIIHYHEVITFTFLGYCPNAKVVVHIHSYRFFSHKFLLPVMFHYINKYATVLLSPTNSISKEAGKLTSKPIIHLDTPYLDLGTIEYTPSEYIKDFIRLKKEGKIVFAFIGRLCSVKRIDHFAKALSFLDEDTKEKVAYCIIGKPNTKGDELYLSNMLHYIEENMLSEYIHFYGYINPIEQVLDYVDVGVLLSESEAVSMVGIELMKYNIPILGYEAPGVCDFVIPEINGYLVSDGDIKELAKVIQNIVNDGSLITTLKPSIAQELKKYSLESFVRNINSIYKRV
ncbi:glycosyltransferase family 4 protein [Bacteroides nordii]|jgi:glycosyltransferase involved in cell wall biosynthesis|uniref:glycosyltransferase family 4 protein n=1 Tax=Bacteroides nordii TaxID=291645 RepID=UPI00189FDEF2|nr:glycosyltransferase family 4 protein [Bacteroides nordii]